MFEKGQKVVVDMNVTRGGIRLANAIVTRIWKHVVAVQFIHEAKSEPGFVGLSGRQTVDRSRIIDVTKQDIVMQALGAIGDRKRTTSEVHYQLGEMFPEHGLTIHQVKSILDYLVATDTTNEIYKDGVCYSLK